MHAMLDIPVVGKPMYSVRKKRKRKKMLKKEESLFFPTIDEYRNRERMRETINLYE